MNRAEANARKEQQAVNAGTGTAQKRVSTPVDDRDVGNTFPPPPMLRRASDTFPPAVSPSLTRTHQAVTASLRECNDQDVSPAANNADEERPPFPLGDATYAFDDSMSDSVLNPPARGLLQAGKEPSLPNSQMGNQDLIPNTSQKPRDNLSVTSDEPPAKPSTGGDDRLPPRSLKKTTDSSDSKAEGVLDKGEYGGPGDDLQSLEESDDAYNELTNWWKHILHSSSFQLQLALLVIGAIVWGVGAAIRNHTSDDQKSFLIGESDVYVWEILLFSGATLVLYVGCSFLNWLVFTGVSYLVTSRFWAVALYLAAFDGPLRNVLFASIMWIVWSAYLPPFGNVRDRVLTLLVTMAGLDAAKELLLKVFKGKVTKDQFKERLMSIVERMIILQNLSALAVTVNRERKKRRQKHNAATTSGVSSNSVDVGIERDEPLERESKEKGVSPSRVSDKRTPTAMEPERQHSTIAPLSPISKMMRNGKGQHVTHEGSDGLASKSQTDVSPTDTVVNVQPEVTSETTGDNEFKNSASSDSLPNAVNASDLRDIHHAEQRYHILAGEVKKGKFKLFDGKGDIITINNGSIARKAAASIFNHLDLRRASTITVRDLMELPSAPMTEDEAEEVIAKLGFRVDKQISRRGFIMFANKVYSDFCGLGSTLKSYNVVTRAVRILLNVVYVIFCFVLALLVFQVSPTAVLIPAATLLVSLSFAVGTTANNFIQSLVYILAWSPYNVGDRVRVNDSVPMWVHDIDVYHTAFRRLDNSIEMHANHVLSGCRIRNETRATCAVIELPIRVGYRTSALQLDKLTTAVIHWIRERKHVWREDFVEFYIYDISANEHLDISFWIGHRFTFHNGAALWGDTSKLRMFILETMRRLGIEYVKATQPVYIGSREEIAESIPALNHDPNYDPELHHKPNALQETASTTSEGTHYGESPANLSESIGAFRDTYKNPVQETEADGYRRRGRSHSPIGGLRSNMYSAPDLASLSKEQALKLRMNESIPDRVKTSENVTKHASSDTRKQFENALAAPPLTPQRLGLLRIDDARDMKIAQFDSETHARNFVDIRAGGVHNTWNWSLPLHQRSTVFTAPEHIEYILKKNDPDSYDAKILKGLGYGLSLQAAKAKQQQTRQRGKGTQAQQTSSADFSKMMMPGSFGGIQLAKRHSTNLDSSDRVPLGAVQTLLKDTLREKDKAGDFHKMTPGQKLLQSLSKGGIYPTARTAVEPKRNAPAPPEGDSTRARFPEPSAATKRGGRSTPP